MSENYRNIIRSLPPTFDTEKGHHIGREFNSPCIIGSTLYQRQTGALTSNFLKVLTKDCVDDLLKTERDQCRIQFITHPKLEEVDKKALKNYLDNRSKLDAYLEILMERSINEFLNSSDYEIDKESRLDIFTTLVAKKTIIIKFGFPKNPYNLFHKKTGIFHFDWGDKIGFIGGHNDTEGGLQNNIEILGTRQSWISENDLTIINDYENDFNKSWNNKSLNVETRPLTKKNLDKLEKAGDKFFKKKKSLPSITTENKISSSIEREMEDKWSFQDDAVKIFLKEKAGILEMATGTGKTRTTFKIIDKLLDQKKINKIIIQMKGEPLINQWIEETGLWKLNKNETIRILRQDQNKKDKEIFVSNFNNPGIDILFVSQLSLSNLLTEIQDFDLSKTIIIHDEVHNLPTPKMIDEIRGLQKGIHFRLGLSATVRDDNDDPERIKDLFREVGPIIFEFDVKKAIQKGILVEFDVLHLDYELTQTEKRERKNWNIWRDMQKKKAEMPLTEIDKIANREISKIYKLANNKIGILENYVRSNRSLLEKCFIFVQQVDYGDLLLNKLLKYISEIKTHYEEHADDENLKEFAIGDLKCIINCKMLNEGINLKNLSNIVLIASESQRQLTQRLGRVLRIDEQNDPDKRAFVLDFIEKEQRENKDGPDYKRLVILNDISKTKHEII